MHSPLSCWKSGLGSPRCGHSSTRSIQASSFIRTFPKMHVQHLLKKRRAPRGFARRDVDARLLRYGLRVQHLLQGFVRHRNRPFSHVFLRKAVGEIRTAGRVVAPLVGHGDASLEDFVVVVASPSERDGQRAHDVFGRHSDQFKVFRVCTVRGR